MLDELTLVRDELTFTKNNVTSMLIKLSELMLMGANWIKGHNINKGDLRYIAVQHSGT